MPSRVASLLTCTLLLAGCTSGDPEAAAPPVASSPPIAPASTTSPSPSVVDGRGYHFRVPPGWENVTAEVRQIRPDADSAVRVVGTETRFRTNVNVFVSRAHGVSNISSQARAYARELAPDARTQVSRLPKATIDGAVAIGQRARFTAQGTEVVVVQRFVVHDGRVYGVTLTSVPRSIATDIRVLGRLLRTWSWS